MDLLKNLRSATRGLLRTRGFALLIVGTIALGVGVNTAIFSVVNALVFRPLPFPQAERLVFVDAQAPERGTSDWMSTSYRDFLDWQAASTAFERMAAFRDAPFELSGAGEAERVSGVVATEELFRTLRQPPLLGRTFTAGEGEPGREAVVVVGHDLWTRRFGADPAAVGSTVLLGGHAHTVVGVMPPGFRFPEFAELWVPLRADPVRARRDERNMAVVGRLAPGHTLEAALSELATVNWRIADAHPETNEGVIVTARPLKEALRGGETTLAAILFQGITLLVLVIAWVNVASLLLVRSVARRREMAVRAALGATRSQVLLQLFAEGVVLAVVGGAGGLLLGWWGRNLLAASVPVELPFWVSLDFDWRVLAFAAAVSGLGVLVFTTVPALKASQPDLQAALKAGSGRGATAGKGGARVQDALVVTETALALVLLLAAGLLAKSLVRLNAVDPGFEAAGVVTARVSLPSSRYPTAADQRALWARLAEAAAEVPGVEAAASVGSLPLTGGGSGRGVVVDGYAPADNGKAPFVLGNVVSPDYFRAMGIPQRGGRPFTGGDGPASPGVAVVSESLAGRFWPGETALGKRIRFASDGADQWREVVGVVGDVRDTRLANPAWPTLYVPTAQSAMTSGRLVVRTQGSDPAALVPALRSRTAAIDPGLPLDQAWTMTEVVARSMWLSRLYAWLAGVFAVIALMMAAVGVYGLLDYTVRQRTQEIGVRSALGAGRQEIVWLFVRRGVWLAALAVLVGLPAGWVLSRLLSSLLYGVGPADPLVFAGVPLAILAVSLVASFFPARTAARVDPAIALRQE